MGQIGEIVFALVCNVKETNDAIRWCNTHKVGDVLERDDYKIEILEREYDVLDIAVMLRDSQRNLKTLFSDYDTKIEPWKNLLRRMMNDIPTDKVLDGLIHALQAVVDANGGQYGDKHTIQVQSLWLCAAAKELLDIENQQTD